MSITDNQQQGQRTMLKTEQKTMRSRSAPVCHIVLINGFQIGNMKRNQGDALCKPADKFVGFIEAISGVAICAKCLQVAERYNMPLPNNISFGLFPSARELQPGDLQVRYEMRSKWHGYLYGIPFKGILRKWEWVRRNTRCANCGNPISLKTGHETVLGLLADAYVVCTGLTQHSIKDARDLIWQAGFIIINPGIDGLDLPATEVLSGYPDLRVANEDDDEIPF